MSDSVMFQDQPQIERIRERFWNGREFGGAAVMVGAGFSRNAERRSASNPPFPLWSETAQAMYEALYPSNNVQSSDREDGRSQLASGVEASRLASEYEIVFGRSALDDLLACLRIRPPSRTASLASLVRRLHNQLRRVAREDAPGGRKFDLVLTASAMPA